MNVYLLKRGNLNSKTNMFEFYDTEIFSSKSKALRSIDNGIECNNGYAVSKEEIGFGSGQFLEVTYNCMSAPDNGVCSPMRIRLCLYKKEVR